MFSLNWSTQKWKSFWSRRWKPGPSETQKKQDPYCPIPVTLPYSKIMQITKLIARHELENDGEIHENNVWNILENFGGTWADLTRHNLIEMSHGTSSKIPTEYYRLTEYAWSCITPKKWFK